MRLDDNLIEEAVKLGRHPTKKAAVTAALKEYIERHKQQEILNLFNVIEYDESCHYKKHRKRKKMDESHR